MNLIIKLVDKLEYKSPKSKKVLLKERQECWDYLDAMEHDVELLEKQYNRYERECKDDYNGVRDVYLKVVKHYNDYKEDIY